MTSKTPEEICKYFKKRLQYVYGAKDSKPTSDELYQARDLKQEVKKKIDYVIYITMIDINLIEENIVPFLCGMGSTLLIYGLYKVSKMCCCV